MTRAEFFETLNGGAKWDIGVAINRTNPVPIDANEVFDSTSSLESYLKTNPVAYPGQIVTVISEAEVTAYVVQSTGAEGASYTKLAATTASGDVTADITKLYAEVDALKTRMDAVEKAVKAGLEYKIVDQLPETGIKGIIYLVADATGEKDAYDEFIWIETDEGIGKYEKLGSTAANLNDYYTKSETDSAIDVKVKTVSDQLANKQDANANLTALAGLTGTGLVKRDASGSFAVDTNIYLTASALEGYAQTTVTDALSEKITANEEAIAAINNAETGVLAQAKAYTDASKYDDTTLAGKVADNTSAIGENTSAIASINTDLGTVKSSVSANTSAIAAINDAETGILKTAETYADNKAAANKTLIDSLTSRVSANETAIAAKAEQSALQAEIDRATAAEEANKKAIDLILDNPDTETIDSIKELTKYVEEDGKTTASLVNRLAGIGGVDEPATVMDAINAASVKIATDEVIGGLKTSANFKVDATEGTVTAVSTDILTQGENELILFGGNAD